MRAGAPSASRAASGEAGQGGFRLRARRRATGLAIRPPMGLNLRMAATPDALLPRILELIEPFNKKGFVVTAETRFADHLELDSLTVMDFVANVEDEWDVVLPINMLPEIETVGQLSEAVARLVAAKGQAA